LECYKNATFGQWIQASECGAALQLGKRHIQEQLGDTLVGEGIAHHVDTREIKHHPLVVVDQRQKFLPELLTQYNIGTVLLL
jgi:hypothetical protein